MKGVFNFYLEGSIHVSMAVCAFAAMSFATFHTPVDIPFLVFLFLGTITGYNFVKYAPLAGFHHRSLTRHIKAIQIFSFLLFFAFLYAYYTMPGVIQLGSFVLGLLTLFYIIPFLKSHNLRNLSGLKIFVVAFVWAGVTVLLPWLLHLETSSASMGMVFLQRFLWVLVLTLPFEIRDMVYDDPNLGTIPQRLGIKGTRIFGMGILLAIFVLELGREGRDVSELLLLGVMLLITGVFLIISEKNQSRYLSAFWVESIPILWWVLYQIF